MRQNRIMYVCGNCAEAYPEGCGHYDARDLRVMPDGTWLCDGCYDDTKAGDYGLQASEDDGLPCWSDLPKPPEYVPVTAIAAQVKELGPMEPVTAEFRPRHLLGQLTNGFERDKGRIVHAVPVGKSTALCGRSYGRRSVGWSEADEAVTCPRCLSKLKKLG